MQKEEYEKINHQFVFSKSVGKHYCVKCGLVALNNPFTEWAIDKGCLNELHPAYKSTKRKLTEF